MKIITRSVCIILILLSIWTIKTSPISIVGAYPMLTAFFSLLILFIALLFLIVSFSKGGELSKSLKNLVITISIIGGIGIFPGMIFTGIHFKKAKSNNLIKNGVVCKAIIESKKSHQTIRRGQETKSFELHFKFETQEKAIQQSYEVVSEDEFYTVNEGDSILVIYSRTKPTIVDVIIDDKSYQTYKTKLQGNN